MRVSLFNGVSCTSSKLQGLKSADEISRKRFPSYTICMQVTSYTDVFMLNVDITPL